MNRQTTRAVEVIVESFYLEDHSSPKDRHFLWGYQVAIVNHGRETVRLLRRNWRISDKSGHSRVVTGKGVVGEQPALRPGETFEYSSFAQLNAEAGIMAGTYEMVDEDGEVFSVAIPAFSLEAPSSSSGYH